MTDSKPISQDQDSSQITVSAETEGEKTANETVDEVTAIKSGTLVSHDRQDDEDDTSSEYNTSMYTDSVASLANREVKIDRKDLTDPPSISAIDTSILNKAIKSVKRKMTEKNVINELQNIWLLYEDGQRLLSKQNMTISKYKKTIEKLDEEAKHDKRVMRAIYYADRHRQAHNALEQLNCELEKSLKDRDELQIPTMSNRIKQLVKDLDRAKHQTRNLNRLQEKFVDLEFSYNKCQSMLRTMKTDANAEAAEKIRENQAMVDAILEKSQNEITNIVSEKNLIIGTLKRKLAKYTMDNQDKKDHIKLLSEGLKDCEMALSQSETQLKACRMKTAKLETANRDLEAILEANKSSILHMVNTKKQHDNDLRAAKNDIAELKGFNEKLSNELSHTKYEMNGLHRINRKLTEEREKVVSELVQQRNKGEEIMNRFNMDKKEMEKMNSKLIKDHEEIKMLTLKCESLAQKINSLKTDAHNKDSLIHRQELETKHTQIMNQQMESELSNKDRRINGFIFNTEKLYSHALELQNMMKECEENNNTLTTYVEYLEKTHDLLEEQLQEEEKKTFTCKRKNASMDVQMNATLDMYSQKVSDLDRNVSEINNLVQENMAFEKLIVEKQHEIERGERNFATKTLECVQIEAQVHQLKQELQTKQNTLNQVMVRNNDLREKLKVQILTGNDLERMRDFQQGRADMRSAELMLLENRMSLSEKKLNIGTRELTARNKDVRILIDEIKNLRRKLNIRDKEVENHKVLKERHTVVVRQLTMTQGKLVALQEMKPTMIHPHRHLMAVDRNAYDLHAKVNHLTQQLIRKTTEVAEKEDLIIQKDKLFLEFKAMLMRRGDPKETAEELWRVKKSLQLKEREIKCLRAELTTSMHTASEAKNTLVGERQKLDAAKNNLIKEKKMLQRKKLASSSEKNNGSSSEKNNGSSSEKNTGLKDKTPKLPPINRQLKGQTVSL